eukprot:c29549_g1_i1 orf=170-910(-)
MGKFIFKILHAILPKWIPKLEILSSSPRKQAAKFFVSSKRLKLEHTRDDHSSKSSRSKLHHAGERRSAAESHNRNDRDSLSAAAAAADKACVQEAKLPMKNSSDTDINTAVRTAEKEMQQVILDSFSISNCSGDHPGKDMEMGNADNRILSSAHIITTPNCLPSISIELPRTTCEIVGVTTVVVVCSYDPFHDFWESMCEMISENGLWDMENLQYLLYCYFSLNDPKLFGFIEKAFVQVLMDLHNA